MKNVLEIKDLSKSYNGKKLALSGCCFNLEEGKICAIVGESGSGKSTLLRLIAGLERPDSGTITNNGAVTSSDKHFERPEKRNLGFVFQDFALFPHLTVGENIAFGLKSDKNERITQLLKLVDMEGYVNSYPSQLSGGQEQRVALARTLATKPELLLMDEPFSNLDTVLKSKLRRDIRNILKSIGASMIFITHDLFDAIDIADEIIFLKDGKMIQHNLIGDFWKKSEHDEVNTMVSKLKSDAEHILSILN
jgi:iron(III) transport system ATP-binding protein